MNKSNKEQNAPKGLRDYRQRPGSQKEPLSKPGGLYVVHVTKVGYVWAPNELEASEYADEILSTESEKTTQVCPVSSSNLNPLNWDLDCLVYHDGEESDDFPLRKAVETMKGSERPSSGAPDQPTKISDRESKRYSLDHPIQLSKDQVEALLMDEDIGKIKISEIIKTAAQAGADMQLEKCCEWIEKELLWPTKSSRLRAAMRPRPLSKREKALKLVDLPSKYEQATVCLTSEEIALVREALMEGQGDG